MIARIWKGSVRLGDKAAYHAYMQQTGLPEYQACKGNRGVTLLCREYDGRAEFTFITLWDSLEAIKEFAGPAYENAVYYREDKKFLLEMEPKVLHYQVLEQA